jgi:hypothetical protein
MLAASFSLIQEGMELHPLRTIAGIGAGLGLIWLAKALLPSQTEMTEQANARRKIFLIMAVMTAHSAAEGVGVGVAWGGGERLGEFITLAIALHNIPEGLAIALVMVPRGASVLRAGLFAIGSSLPQPLLAVPAFLFVLAFAPWLPVGLGLAPVRCCGWSSRNCCPRRANMSRTACWARWSPRPSRRCWPSRCCWTDTDHIAAGHLAPAPPPRHIWNMLKLTPLLLALAYAFLVYQFSSWRTRSELDSRSTVLADRRLNGLTDRMAKALDLPKIACMSTRSSRSTASPRRTGGSSSPAVSCRNTPPARCRPRNWPRSSRTSWGMWRSGIRASG